MNYNYLKLLNLILVQLDGFVKLDMTFEKTRKSESSVCVSQNE